MKSEKQFVYILDTDCFFGEDKDPEKSIRRIKVERVGFASCWIAGKEWFLGYNEDGGTSLFATYEEAKLAGIRSETERMAFSREELQDYIQRNLDRLKSREEVIMSLTKATQEQADKCEKIFKVTEDTTLRDVRGKLGLTMVFEMQGRIFNRKLASMDFVDEDGADYGRDELAELIHSERYSLKIYF